MLEVRSRLGLNQETLGTDHCCQLRLQNLQGHVAVMAKVLGKIDRSHPTLADLTLDAIAAFEGRVQTG